MQDTIFALASGAGRSAISVFRLSGPRSIWAVEALSGTACPADRKLRLRTLRRPTDHEPIDQALVVGFAEAESFTGEACAELHCHGGRAVVAAISSALASLEGLRPASAGEFARRALENGRLNLLQVEAIADLVNAETEAQRRQAFGGMRGGLAARALAWRESLLQALAWLEVELDFSDQDVDEGLFAEAVARLSDVAREIGAEVSRGISARLIRDGFVVALVGAPNVGKSSLLNAIMRRDIAITSAFAGTTRDTLEAQCDLGGFCVSFLDTAGLQDTEDPLDAMGVARGRARAAEADLRIFVADPDHDFVVDGEQDGDIFVSNKADLRGKRRSSEGLAVSALTGEGVDHLLERVAEVVRSRVDEDAVVFRERHLAVMNRAVSLLESAVAQSRPECAAEDVRGAAGALEALLGRIDVEDVLGEIFSGFCIGK